MTKKENSFREKILLVVIDKLAIGLLILLVGYYISLALKKVEYSNSELLKDYQSQFEIKLRQMDMEFALRRDSFNRSYLEETEKHERIYVQEREDLIRREDQFNKERFALLETEKEVRLEIAKGNRNLSNIWTESSVDRIGKAWELINKVNFSSEIVENSAAGTFTRISNQIEDTIKIYQRLHLEAEDKAHRPLPKGDYIRNLEQKLSDIEKLKEDELITLLELDSLNYQIVETAKYINLNRFWIGEKQRKGMLDFLNSLKHFIYRIPRASSLEEIEELIFLINSKRFDIYKLRNDLFEGEIY